MSATDLLSHINANGVRVQADHVLKGGCFSGVSRSELMISVHTGAGNGAVVVGDAHEILAHAHRGHGSA